MIRFEGTYFDGKSSMAHPVGISSDGTVIRIRGEDGQMMAEVPLRVCVITPALGTTRRSFRLPDDARCETDDTEAISDLERQKGENPGMRFVHLLESHWMWVAVCMVTLLVCVWLFMSHGIPFLAKGAAKAVPYPVMEKISQKALTMLDDKFFKPSELDLANREKLTALFQDISREIGTGPDYRLEFRKSPRIGPNAFALPSGLILMTDELVKLAENDREVLGVLIHEMAHVEKRHGLRQVIQNAGVFLLISALVGDIISITSTAATLPTLLIESGYSRKFEREADEAAGLYFIKKGWSIRAYQDILVRITKNEPKYTGSSLLSTHPATDERVKYLQSLENAGVK